MPIIWDELVFNVDLTFKSTIPEGWPGAQAVFWSGGKVVGRTAIRVFEPFFQGGRSPTIPSRLLGDVPPLKFFL